MHDELEILMQDGMIQIDDIVIMVVMANNSKYVYIKMKNEVDQGGVAPELLPMGYQGPVRWGTFQILSGSTLRLQFQAQPVDQEQNLKQQW